MTWFNWIEKNEDDYDENVCSLFPPQKVDPLSNDPLRSWWHFPFRAFHTPIRKKRKRHRPNKYPGRFIHFFHQRVSVFLYFLTFSICVFPTHYACAEINFVEVGVWYLRGRKMSAADQTLSFCVYWVCSIKRREKASESVKSREGPTYIYTHRDKSTLRVAQIEFGRAQYVSPQISSNK